MKNTFISLIILACVITGSAGEKANIFAIKSGSIKYNLSGSTTGTKTMYWNNYGENTRTEIDSKTVTKMFGFTNEDKTHTITVMIKDTFWVANLITKEGQTGTLPYYKEVKENVEGMSKVERKQFEDDILASLGGSKLGTEKFLNYNCEVMSVMGAKIWIYKGVALKTDINIMGIKSKETATVFKPNTRVSKDMFKPSTAVKYNNIPQQQATAAAGLASMFGSSKSSGGKKEEASIAGLFGAVAATAEANSDYDDDEDDYDDDYEAIPIKYPFASFKEAVGKAKIPAGYRAMGIMNIEQESYASTYMAGGNILIISAISGDEKYDEDVKASQKFKHKGKKCTYVVMEKEEEDDDQRTVLTVEYPKKKMNIFIVSAPKNMSKADLLKIADSLNFK